MVLTATAVSMIAGKIHAVAELYPTATPVKTPEEDPSGVDGGPNPKHRHP
jgi:hypothetical protein